MQDLKKVSILLQKGEADKLSELVKNCIAEGLSAEDILNKGLLQGMMVVGEEFRDGKIFIPEVLLAARAMHRAMDIIEPELISAEVEPKGKMLIGTVQGDLHDIGKNLASILFKGAGFEIIDLGVNVSTEQFVAEAIKHNPDIIGMSALLTSTMVNMKNVIDSLRARGIKSRIIVGGAPVTQRFADDIKADIYARSAMDGVEKVLHSTG